MGAPEADHHTVVDFVLPVGFDGGDLLSDLLVLQFVFGVFDFFQESVGAAGLERGFAVDLPHGGHGGLKLLLRLDGVADGDGAVVDFEDVLGFGPDVHVQIFKLLLPDETSPVPLFVAVDEGLVFRHDGSECFSLSVGKVGVERWGNNAVLGDLFSLVDVVYVFSVFFFVFLAEVLVPTVVLGFFILVEGQSRDVVGLHSE